MDDIKLTIKANDDSVTDFDALTGGGLEPIGPDGPSAVYAVRLDEYYDAADMERVRAKLSRYLGGAKVVVCPPGADVRRLSPYRYEWEDGTVVGFATSAELERFLTVLECRKVLTSSFDDCPVDEEVRVRVNAILYLRRHAPDVLRLIPWRACLKGEVLAGIDGELQNRTTDVGALSLNEIRKIRGLPPHKSVFRGGPKDGDPVCGVTTPTVSCVISRRPVPAAADHGPDYARAVYVRLKNGDYAFDPKQGDLRDTRWQEYEELVLASDGTVAGWNLKADATKFRPDPARRAGPSQASGATGAFPIPDEHLSAVLEHAQQTMPSNPQATPASYLRCGRDLAV